MYKAGAQCLSALDAIFSVKCNNHMSLLVSFGFTGFLDYEMAQFMMLKSKIMLLEMFFNELWLFKCDHGNRMDRYQYKSQAYKVNGIKCMRTLFHGTSSEGPISAAGSSLFALSSSHPKHNNATFRILLKMIPKAAQGST